MPEIHFTTSSCCFQICFFIHLYLGKWSNLTNYLSNGLVQPPTRFRCREFIAICPTLNLGGYQLGLEAGGTIPPLPTLGIYCSIRDISPTQMDSGSAFCIAIQRIRMSCVYISQIHQEILWETLCNKLANSFWWERPMTWWAFQMFSTAVHEKER